MRRNLIILIFALLCPILSAQTATAPAAGDGSESNPYEIATLENLYWIAADNDAVPDPEQQERLGYHYIQTADIDASETADWFEGAGWFPIGDNSTGNSTSRFTGSYEGDYHIISGLYINRPVSNFTGLFGFASNATITNLGLTDVDITGSDHVGGLAGVLHHIFALVETCFTSGSVSGNFETGGLIGKISAGTVSNSYSEAAVNGEETTGGLAGRLDTDGSIENSYTVNIVEGVHFVGGIVGRMDNGAILYCYSSGTVSGLAYVGGLVGRNVESLLQYSYSLSEINGNSYVGGLSGEHRTSSVIDHCYSTGPVNGNSSVGGLTGEIWYQSEINNSYSLSNINTTESYFNPNGLTGYVYRSTVYNSYYNYETVLIDGENLITIGALDDEMFNEWLDNDLQLEIDDYLVSDGDAYLVESVEDLQKLLCFGQFEDVKFLLTEDLDLAGDPGFYIPYFRGEFDGNGHEILNLSVEMNNYLNLGLFGYVVNGTIRNLNLRDLFLRGSHYVGGLAGYMFLESEIDNCSVSGEIVGSSFIGGLAGLCSASLITRSSSSVEIDGTNDAGGLIGGLIDGTEVRMCFSTGDVEGYLQTGGLIGSKWGNCVIEDSFARGNVTGQDYVGGLVGNMWDGEILRSFSTGEVTYNEGGGGLIGSPDGSVTVEASYWDIDSSGQTESAGGEGRTTEEMTWPHAQNTYEDWDFTEIWLADEEYIVNHGYPYLQATEHQVSVEDDLIVDAGKFTLSNYPNPFNPETTISYSLPEDVESLELKIYNIKGQIVRELIPAVPHESGEFQVRWDGRDNLGRQVSSGVYFARLIIPDMERINKMLLVK